MPYCSHCGRAVGGERFCAGCGTPTAAAAAAPPHVSTATTEPTQELPAPLRPVAPPPPAIPPAMPPPATSPPSIPPPAEAQRAGGAAASVATQGDGARSPSRRWLLPVAALLAVVLLAVGAVALNLVRSGKAAGAGSATSTASPATGHAATPTAPSPGSASVAPTSVSGSTSSSSSVSSSSRTRPGPSSTAAQANAEALRLDDLLSFSSSSRSVVVSAVQDVDYCRAYDAETRLRSAEQARLTLVARAQGEDVSHLPGGAAMIRELVAAWRASARADGHYADWARDQSFCMDRAAATPDSAAGLAESRTAERHKRTFLALWRPVATRYHLATRTDRTI